MAFVLNFLKCWQTVRGPSGLPSAWPVDGQHSIAVYANKWPYLLWGAYVTLDAGAVQWICIYSSEIWLRTWARVRRQTMWNQWKAVQFMRIIRRLRHGLIGFVFEPRCELERRLMCSINNCFSRLYFRIRLDMFAFWQSYFINMSSVYTVQRTVQAR